MYGLGDRDPRVPMCSSTSGLPCYTPGGTLVTPGTQTMAILRSHPPAGWSYNPKTRRFRETATGREATVPDNMAEIEQLLNRKHSIADSLLRMAALALVGAYAVKKILS